MSEFTTRSAIHHDATRHAISTFKELGEIPVVKTAQFHRDDIHNGSERDDEGRVIRLSLSSRSFSSMSRNTHRPTIALSASARKDQVPDAHWSSGSPAIETEHDTIKASFGPHPLASGSLDEGPLSAILRERPGKKGQQKHRAVELWVAERCAASVDVTEAHGPFYTDDLYASLSIHNDRVLYTAQAKAPQRVADVTKRSTKNSVEGCDGLEGYEFHPPLGSLYTGRNYPVTFLLCFNLSEEHRRPQLFHLDPSHAAFDVGQTQEAGADTKQMRNALLSQAIFSTTGRDVILTAYPPIQDGRRLGLAACTNRPSIVYHIDMDALLTAEESQTGSTDEDHTKLLFSAPWRPASWRRLSESGYSGRSPSLGGRGAFYWLESESGGAHRDCDRLVSWRGAESGKPQIALAIQAVPLPTTGWPGLFCDRLPRSCALTQHDAIAFSTIWGSRRTIMIYLSSRHHNALPFEATPPAIRIESRSDGSTGDPDALWSYELLCTDGQDLLLAVRSSPCHPQEVILGRLIGGEARVQWALVRRMAQPWNSAGSVVPSIHDNIRARLFNVPDTCDELKEGDQSAEAIFIFPRRSKASSTAPLPGILMPHGGPHSSSTTEYSPSLAALCLAGYCIVLPNYHGSLGKGQQYAHSLLGKCGSLDVNDCIATVRCLVGQGDLLPRLDASRLFVDGGSHGGFLALHLVGQFPETFRAAICRNPVTSAHIMEYTNDIPDWFYSEFGHPFDFADPPSCITTAQFDQLASASPFAHLDAVRAPVLLLVGLNDQRVAPSQAKLVYHALLSRARRDGRALKNGTIPVRMLTFDEEDHPLDGIEAELVCMEARVRWLLENGAARETLVGSVRG